MSDFTEKDHSTTSPLVSSVDTPIVSDNHLVTDTLADPVTTAATIAKLSEFREFPGKFPGTVHEVLITQDDTEPTPI